MFFFSQRKWGILICQYGNIFIINDTDYYNILTDILLLKCDPVGIAATIANLITAVGEGF